MKKILKVVLIIFIVVAVVLCGLAYWQRANLKALKMAMTHDTDEIAAQMSKQNQDLKKQIEVYFPDGIRDFTAEELEQIEKGEATEQQILAKIIEEAIASSVQNSTSEIKINTHEQKEALVKNIVEAIVRVIENNPKMNINTKDKNVIKIIEEAVLSALDTSQTNNASIQTVLSENVVKSVTSALKDNTQTAVKQKDSATLEKIVSDVINKTLQPNTNDTATQETTTKPALSTQQEIIGRYTAKMYALEGEYIGKIEGLISSARAEYISRRNGKNNRDIQMSIITSYIGKAAALESQCDAEVAAVLSQLRSELSAIGADTAIISTMQSAYENEKIAKRAYYISKYTS